MKPGLKALIIILTIFSACLVRAESVIDNKAFLTQKVEVFGLAGTPWEDGFSFEEERSRAWMDALHHAYENILNLPLMEGKLVRQVMQTNPALKERLGMMLLSAPKTFFQPDATGLARCKVEVPLSGKLSLRSALYLAALRPQSQKPLSFLASWTTALNKKELPTPEFERLVIDVRDFYFEPSLFPRIFDNRGALIFQEALIPIPARFSRPAVKFTTDISLACADLSEAEFMIAEASVNELSCRDVTISDPDATIVAGFCRRLIKSPQKTGEIIIVFDPKTESPAGSMAKTKAEKQEKKTAK